MKSFLTLVCAVFIPVAAFAEGTTFPASPQETLPPENLVDIGLFDGKTLNGDIVAGSGTFIDGVFQGQPVFEVSGRQCGVKLKKEVFLSPQSTVSWAWRKSGGGVCVVQFEVINPQTNQHRYFGYGAGKLTEAESADPTVEVFVHDTIPAEWTAVTRNVSEDLKDQLGWESAKLVAVYLSPWDGGPGWFSAAKVEHASTTDLVAAAKQRELHALSEAGLGEYVPQRLKKAADHREKTFETSFEEYAPTRNSGANEWSAFGAIGNMDFNCMGRDLLVRYPVFDLHFCLVENGREIEPGTLDSFRLGLVNGKLPAVWGGWEHEGLRYKVSAMTIPDPENGHYDLYKLEVRNPGGAPIESTLLAQIIGPPDLHIEDGVVKGLGGAPFLLAEPPGKTECTFGDWGVCDKRAKAYSGGGMAGLTESAFDSYRLGLDGVPVVYRIKAEPGRKYTVCFGATPSAGGGYGQERPAKAGDLVYRYQAEGAEPKTLDYVLYTQQKAQPLFAMLEGAHDTDGDGYIEVRAGVTEASRLKYTPLSAIYVFPAGALLPNPEDVYGGKLNDRCVAHINVGATPEQSWNNQEYDKSDLGFARLHMSYAATIQPGEVRTWWIKAPPIHRRQPVSMGYIAHAFRDVLPGEAIPPYGADKTAALQKADPKQAEVLLDKFWETFFKDAAEFTMPDPVLRNIYLSRLATRAILSVNISDRVSYNPCSPFFYFDHAYRDQAYVIYAFDLAGLHDEAGALLRVYCMDAKDVTERGPIAFDGKPLQLGMAEDGHWLTRPGQHDTQGENIWALTQHYKLSGDRDWLENTAYPYIKRAAQWIVNSRHKCMDAILDPADLRYGLIEPGGMEVIDVGKGMHMFYMNAFAILGLRETASVARSLGREEDQEGFEKEARDLQSSLTRAFEQTFKRTGLYEGYLWFGLEPEGVGMYGFWAHNALLWPCRAVQPHDPLWTATLRKMEVMSNRWGGGMHSEAEGSFWPYIGVDRAVGYILRGEPDKAADYFCAYTDTAGGTFSWGEGYNNLIAAGDQPHMWADAQWINLFRQMCSFEDGSTLLLTPATLRRWQQPGRQVQLAKWPTHFGELKLTIEPSADGGRIDYRFTITPKGDQEKRSLDRIILHPRTPDGRPITGASIDGQPAPCGTDSIVIAHPVRGREKRVEVQVGE